MFDFRFEGDNTITLLDQPDTVKREIKPIWAEELNILGVDRFFDYPKDCETPLLWRCASRYYYCGICVFKTKYIDPDTQPEIDLLENASLFKSFEPINMEALIERNKPLLEKLWNATIDAARIALSNKQNETETFICGYSGGKDSTVLLDLVLKIIPLDKLVIQYSDTGLEFSENIDFANSVISKLLNKHPEIRYIKVSADLPATRTWKIIGFPSRCLRWCCRVHKAAPAIRHGIKASFGKSITITGQRHSESYQRSKYVILEKGELGVLTLHPILEWNSLEIWLHIFLKNLNFSPLYKKGLTRVGCFLCPMSSGTSCFFSKRIEPEKTKALEDIIAVQSRILEREGQSFEEVKNGLCFDAWRGQRGGKYLKIAPRGYVDKLKVIPFIKPSEACLDWLKVANIEWNDCWTFSGKDSRIKKGYAIKALYCVGCGVCAAFCKQQAISFIDNNGEGNRRLLIDFNKCIHCYKCLYVGNGYDRCFAHMRQRINKKETIERIKNEYPTADLLSLQEKINS